MNTRRSILTNLGLLALVGGGAWWARERYIWPEPQPHFDAAQTAWMPFTLPQTSLITVLVGVGEVMVNALVDSGAQYTSIDRAVAEEMGLMRGVSVPMVAMGVGGSTQVAHSVKIDLDLGGATVPGLRVAALDLSALSTGLGVRVPLILGFDVLSTMVAEIDFARRRLRFRPRGSFEASRGGVLAPVRRQGRALLAQVTVEGTPLEVLVDTGATGFIGLSAEAAASAGLIERHSREGRSVVLGGVALSRVVEVEHMAFAGREFRDIEVHIIQLPNVPGFPKGLLGLDSLRPQHVLLDVGGGRMRLTPPTIARQRSKIPAAYLSDRV